MSDFDQFILFVISVLFIVSTYKTWQYEREMSKHLEKRLDDFIESCK